MLRGKAAIMAVIILTALIVAYHWRRGAGTVVVRRRFLHLMLSGAGGAKTDKGIKKCCSAWLSRPQNAKEWPFLSIIYVFYASQLVIHSSAEISQRALLNLDKIKNEYEPLLKRLDEVAREQGDHSPLRVIEDLVHRPNDVAQMLMLVRRCLLASGFLGHCLAQPIPAVSAEAPSPEKRAYIRLAQSDKKISPAVRQRDLRLSNQRSRPRPTAKNGLQASAGPKADMHVN